MKFGKILQQIRKGKGLTQGAVSEYLTRHGCGISNKGISFWESDYSIPSAEQFLLMCQLYEIADIQATFRGEEASYRGINKLNERGRNRAEEYISMLIQNPLFSSPMTKEDERNLAREVRLFDIPVSAGTGSFLDSDNYELLEIDSTVPRETDFAVRVSGDSMEPRFVDGQVIFVKETPSVELGEIGVFELNGESFVKKLGRGELTSLNRRYAAIAVGEFDSFHVFGRVLG